MDVLVWIAEATWQACIDALTRHAPEGVDVTLLYVVDSGLPGHTSGAGAGLLGRRHGGRRDPLADEQTLAEQLGSELLDSASRRASRPVLLRQRHGRIEREVVVEAAGKDLLILARDGDMSRLGPRSIGPSTRFVIDHSPCATLLVWPGRAPDINSIPRPPDRQSPPHP